MPLAHIITDQVVTVAFAGGFTRQVRKDCSMFNRILDLIKSKAADSILLAAMDLASTIKKHASGKFDVGADGVVSVEGESLPNALSKRIIQFANDGFDFEPLLKFWENCKKNPDPRAKTDLYSFLDHNGIPITSDGCFIGYRAIRNDWLDKHSGTMLNTVGATLTMDRALCDSNPNQTCSTGLHVAAYNYAKNHFGGGDDRMIEVKVNPEDVVAIPVDYNGEKMRVCKFTVMSENQDGIIKRSVYDPQNVAPLSVPTEAAQDSEEGAVSTAGGVANDSWKGQKRLKNGRFGKKIKI